MNNNYIVYHLHDDTSNCNGYADSCTSYKEYIKLAKKCGMKAIAFSNHGGIYDWIKKKQDCDKSGIKYIHAVELYLCTKLEADERGYHAGLYARNWDGVKELNSLMSVATSKGKHPDKTDRHAYYNPRISFEELMNTSDNIIVTTACLASALWRLGDKEVLKQPNGQELYNNNLKKRQELLNWLHKNKHRCFLEIQYHKADHQIKYNQQLYEWSKQYDIPLIAGTDTHSSNKYKAECRKILQKSKDSFYGEEDEFDLTWKTYDELVQCFKEQNSLPEEVYMQAIENTNKLADMVEEFKLDKSFKYPNLYGDNSTRLWQQTINNKYKVKKEQGIIDGKDDRYIKKIREEFEAMKKQGMESFMLFMSELVDYCNTNEIPYGFCRGSVGGSEIAYITDITDVDPIKWNTVFSRFCNADRISLADIDIDFSPEDRHKVYKYIIERFTPTKTAYIAQFGTLKDRGTIDTLAKGLDYKDLAVVKNIKNEFEQIYAEYSKIIQEEVNLEELDGEASGIDMDYHEVYKSRIRRQQAIDKIDKLKQGFENLKENNKDIFYYFDGLKGTIISKGNHPAGIIGSPITLPDNLGVFYKDGDENFPVAFCAMKAVDSVNYVKFDILGLKTVGVMKDTYNYIGSHYLKAHEINWNDENVWSDMIKSKVGVFQFEGDYAFELLQKFQPHYINDMSLVNAALRPSGKSYRDRLIMRQFNQNPSKEIDELLKENYGYLIYQEDTIKFLTDICGFSGSLADTTRRCIEENTLVMMGDGNYKKIKDIQVGDYVQSYNKYHISEYKKVINVFNNGQQPVYKIITQHGYEVLATENHKFLTQRGWIQLKNITVNDFIMTPKNINCTSDGLTSNKRLPESDMFLLGLLIGDGSLGNKDNLHFTNSEKIIIDKFKECVNNRLRNKTPCEFTTHEQDGVTVDKVYSIYIKSKNYRSSVVKLLQRYNMLHKAAQKTIPQEIMSYPIGGKIENFLAGLFNTDGGFNTQSSLIEYYTNSYLLASQIKSLLLKYNIYSYVDKKFVPDYNYFTYRLYIRQPDSLRIFKEKILPLMIGKKRDEFALVINNNLNNEDKFNYLLPNECKNEILNMSEITNKSIRSIGQQIGKYNIYDLAVHKTEFGISDVKASNIIKYLYCPYTYELLFADYLPVRVKEVIKEDVANVYDIEVEDNHNYVAGGLIVHNCIGKKDIQGLAEQLPKILEGYCTKSSKPREIAEQEAKQFLQIIDDSSEYQFGLNHSTGYSMNGYASIRLRTYYPLEFITAYLNRAENEEDIKYGVMLAKEKGIKIKPIKFRYSHNNYTFNRDEKSIYKGISSVKGFGEKTNVAEQLYTLKDKQYNNFIELLVDVKENTTVGISHIDILIKLDFFSEFGEMNQLLKGLEIFNNIYGRAQIKKDQLEPLGLTEEMMQKHSKKITEKLYKEFDATKIANELFSGIRPQKTTAAEKLIYENEYLGYLQTTYKCDDSYVIILDINTKYTPVLTCYQLSTGREVKYKVYKNVLFSKPSHENPHSVQLLNVYDIISTGKIQTKNRSRNIGIDEDGKPIFEPIPDEFEEILFSWQMIEKYQPKP